MISLAKGWQVGLAAALHNESQLFTKCFAVPMPRGKCKSLYSWNRCLLHVKKPFLSLKQLESVLKLSLICFRIACAFSEKGRCVFQKSHMRFWKKGHAILWRCTWEKFSIANVKKQCTEWKKTVHWKKVNSVLNRKIQCIVFIIISGVVYSLAYSYLWHDICKSCENVIRCSYHTRDEGPAMGRGAVWKIGEKGHTMLPWL